jgi:hypothetical protein
MKLIPVPWHTEPVFILGLGALLYPQETGFHIYCADWLKREGLAKGWHHSANEAHKTMQGRILAKRMLQSPGFPDWVYPKSNTAIELKVGRGKLSPEQVAWSGEFTNFHVAHNFDEFRQAVQTAMMPIIVAGGLF